MMRGRSALIATTVGTALVTSALAIVVNIATETASAWATVAASVLTVLAASVAYYQTLHSKSAAELTGSDPRLVVAKLLRQIAYQSHSSELAIPLTVLSGGNFMLHQGATISDRSLLAPLGAVLSGTEQSSPILLVGPPGSGKSTLIRSIAGELATQFLNADPAAAMVPILVNANTWSGRFSGFEDWLKSELGTQYEASPDVADAWFKSAKIFLLIDGVDEALDWPKFVDRLAQWYLAHPGITLVVSGRTSALQILSHLLPKATILELQPLPEASIAEYFERQGLRNSEILRELRQTYPLDELGRPATLATLTDAFSHADRLERSTDRLTIPMTALKVLASASLEAGRPYELAEISSRTLLPPETLIPVLDELVVDGVLELTGSASGRRHYQAVSNSSKAPPS